MQSISHSQDALLRLPQVLEVFPVSRSTWFAGVKSGRFPAGVKMSRRMTGWRAEDIKGLLERAKAGDLAAERAQA